MTPKKILLMAHDVTLAHLGRPLQLAEGLIADGHDVTLAASAESSRFLKNFPARVHTLAPTGKARFIDNLAKGRPVFDFETLKCFAEEDEALLASLRPDLVIGDFRLSLSVSARRARIPYATITNAYWSPAFTPRFVVPDLPMVRFLGVGISQFLFDLARPFAFAYHARPTTACRPSATTCGASTPMPTWRCSATCLKSTASRTEIFPAVSSWARSAGHRMFRFPRGGAASTHGGHSSTSRSAVRATNHSCPTWFTNCSNSMLNSSWPLPAKPRCPGIRSSIAPTICLASR